jgi:YVTN family beta-propeller protein
MRRFLGFLTFLLLLALPVSAQSGQSSALLVLNKAEASMSIVDPATLTVVARVPTGEGPHEAVVSADGRLAYVANYGTGPRPGNSISVIDIAARKEVKRVDLGALTRPHGMFEHNGKIYFTAEGARVVGRYDPAADKVDWVMGTGQAVTHMVVVTPDGKKIYTANIGSHTVTAVVSVTNPQGIQGWQVKQISVGRGPEGIAVSPDGKELWVAHRDDGWLSVIDTATDELKHKLEVGKTPIRVEFTRDGKRALVSDAQVGELIVIDAAARTVVKRIPVPGQPIGIEPTPDGRRAFIAAAQANKIVVIDLDKLEVAGSMEPGREPDGMAWAGN